MTTPDLAARPSLFRLILNLIGALASFVMFISGFILMLMGVVAAISETLSLSEAFLGIFGMFLIFLSNKE